MDDTQQSMQDMHDTFWNENQIILSFNVVSRNPRPDKETIIKQLNLESLGKFLEEKGFKLRSFRAEDTPRSVPSPRSDKGDVLTDPFGKYLFDVGVLAPDSVGTDIVSFFNFDELTSSGMTGMTSEAATSGDETNHDDGDMHESQNPQVGPVPRLVNIINASLEELNKGSNKYPPIPISAAAPHWLCGATGPLPQGCPLIPPIPVGDSCDCWHLTLPGLTPELLQSMTGNGVTVFVLDTLPRRKEISKAATGATSHNLLMLDVNDNVTFNYDFLPDAKDVPGPDDPSTGKDVYGRHISFNMPDHGLFVSGIVRDLAPKARVECIRVLDDLCVGTLDLLTQAFQYIHDRMSTGDLQNKPVVINLSLVIPTDDEARGKGLNTPEEIRSCLRDPIKSLVGLGALFVAAAGNEADLRENPLGTRPKALYPGEFANDIPPILGVIPVGAVDKFGVPTSYSSYPGQKGIATWGGEVPTPTPLKPPSSHPTVAVNDAIRGIYSSDVYPPLSADSTEGQYKAPDQNAWAYWIGTSFATPIISAIAARVFELNLMGLLTQSVQDTILGAGGSQQTSWENLDPRIPGVVGGIARGSVIRAVQNCVEEGEDTEEVDVTMTEVDVIVAEVDGTITEVVTVTEEDITYKA